VSGVGLSWSCSISAPHADQLINATSTLNQIRCHVCPTLKVIQPPEGKHLHLC
jgi:hypothetical protein